MGVLLLFCCLLVNSIGIITICLRCSIVGALKHLWLLIGKTIAGIGKKSGTGNI